MEAILTKQFGKSPAHVCYCERLLIACRLQLRRAGKDQMHRNHHRDSPRLLPEASSQVNSLLVPTREHG